MILYVKIKAIIASNNCKRRYRITDAMNETKDKVRYLESLKRHLDQLYYGATPATIINSAIPGIAHTIKQMDFCV